MATTKHSLKFDADSTRSRWLLLTAAVCVAASSGCTSVIGSAYLREAWLDAVDHAAKTAPRTKAATKPADIDTAVDKDDARPPDDAADSRTAADEAAAETGWSPATLDEAADEADRRLAASGGLTAAARGTLFAMLEDTPRQDWPVVIEEFTAALASTQSEGRGAAGKHTPATAAPAPSRPPNVDAGPVAPAQAVDPAAGVEPVAPSPPADPATASTPEPASPVPQAEPAQPAFAIRNPCFASRVRAWGVVDRFETAEFPPGQEVIVYFELDQLSARQSADGHTTRIDTTLRLVDADGRRVHEWTFEPLEETCGSRRRDYFARYLLSLPESAPSGPLRLEIAVSDTLAGRTAHAALPLAVARR